MRFVYISSDKVALSEAKFPTESENMMSNLEGTEKDHETGLSRELEELAEKAKLFASSAKSKATKKAYRSDFEHFVDWCGKHDLSPLPSEPKTVALYFSHMADEDFATATIDRRKTAIAQAHKLNDFESPTSNERVRDVLKGIKRELGTSSNSKRPLNTVEIRRIISGLDFDKLSDCRDAALVLLGYSGGLRRSEIVGLDVSDLEKRKKGLVVRIRQSKTDPEGEGEIVGIPAGRNNETCPVQAVERWLTNAEIEGGPVFRPVRKGGTVVEKRLSGRAVSLVVKGHVASIGLEPSEFGAHSLRSGFATVAAKNGASEREIMKQTRHRSRRVVRKYIEEGSVLETNPAKKLGL